MSWIKLLGFMFCSESRWQFSFSHISWGGERQNERNLRHSFYFSSAHDACPPSPLAIVKFQFCVLSRTLISQHSPGSGSESVHMADSLWDFHWADWGVASQSHAVWISRKAFIPTIVTLKHDLNPELSQNYQVYSFNLLLLRDQITFVQSHYCSIFLSFCWYLCVINSSLFTSAEREPVFPLAWLLWRLLTDYIISIHNLPMLGNFYCFDYSNISCREFK